MKNPMRCLGLANHKYWVLPCSAMKSEARSLYSDAGLQLPGISIQDVLTHSVSCTSGFVKIRPA